VKTVFVGETIDISFSISASGEGAMADPDKIEVRVLNLATDETAIYPDLSLEDEIVYHEITSAGDHIIVVELTDQLGRVRLGIDRLRALPLP
jgi:hypothetical protein